MTSTDKFDICGFWVSFCRSRHHVYADKLFFNINICDFCVAIPTSVAREAPLAEKMIYFCSQTTISISRSFDNPQNIILRSSYSREIDLVPAEASISGENNFIRKEWHRLPTDSLLHNPPIS